MARAWTQQRRRTRKRKAKVSTLKAPVRGETDYRCYLDFDFPGFRLEQFWPTRQYTEGRR